MSDDQLCSSPLAWILPTFLSKCLIRILLFSVLKIKKETPARLQPVKSENVLVSTQLDAPSDNRLAEL